MGAGSVYFVSPLPYIMPDTCKMLKSCLMIELKKINEFQLMESV